MARYAIHSDSCLVQQQAYAGLPCTFSGDESAQARWLRSSLKLTDFNIAAKTLNRSRLFGTINKSISKIVHTGI
jgi:hypothetical protein